MAYVGKYFDRNPTLRPAGVVLPRNCTMEQLMKRYSPEEWAEHVVRYKCYEKVKEQVMRPIKRTPRIDDDEIADLLEIETKKSRFVAFREKFAEVMYFKKPELGRVFQLDSKPEHVTNENTTFGVALDRSEPLYGLVLPEKTPEQVNKEFIAFHNKYLISHQHYLPAERIARGYKSPPYDGGSTFGCKYNADFNGVNVKRCLSTCGTLQIISNAQKGYLERSMGLLGKKVVRYPISEELEFGQRKYIDPHSVKTLIENIEPTGMQSKVLDAVTHIANVRRKLFNRVGYEVTDLKYALESEDPKGSGYLPVSKVYAILRQELIRVNCEQFREALNHYGLIEDECTPNERVRIDAIWKLLCKQYNLPVVGRKGSDCSACCSKDTTYIEMCEDRGKPLPPKRPEIVRKRPGEPEDEPTTMVDLISPEPPVKLGLLPSYFDDPRPKEQIQRIFEKVIDDPFEELWSLTKEKFHIEDELISVNQLRSVVMDLRLKRQLEQQEQFKDFNM